jgi:hypothetical protein
MATELIPADGDDLAALAARINAEFKEATAHLHKGLVHALEVGRLLIEAKARLPHGQWGRWLHENVYIAERTVREYMQLARAHRARAGHGGRFSRGAPAARGGQGAAGVRAPRARAGRVRWPARRPCPGAVRSAAPASL